MCISGSPDRATHDGELRLVLLFIFSSIFLSLLLLLSCWSGCCKICHLPSFYLNYRRVCLCTCSCHAMVSVHFQVLVCFYFPVKLLFRSIILVLTLKMADASILFNSFMYFGCSPAFQFIFSRRNCILLCYVASIFSVVVGSYVTIRGFGAP